MSAKFVTVEGIEGSGKTTLLTGLSMWLAARGIEVVTTREPGGTVLGNRLRAVFVEPGLPIAGLAEAFVVNASRAQHVEEVIEPALQAGRWVLCDRFADVIHRVALARLLPRRHLRPGAAERARGTVRRARRVVVGEDDAQVAERDLVPEREGAAHVPTFLP